MPLASLTSKRIEELYRTLETSGRRNGKGELSGQGLGARTVRYVHTILRAALRAAVEAEPTLIAKNPADKANPPTAEDAKPPEMHPWTAVQLRAFLDWSKQTARCTPRGACSPTPVCGAASASRFAGVTSISTRV